MAEQEIDENLWNEFQEELKKAQETINTNPISTKISTQSEYLDEFWIKFLTEKFPEGQINKVLEKNFAIYICQNKINIDNIKECYNKNNWSYNGLLGWIKKVNEGEITTFNIKEILEWANNHHLKSVPLLEKAKAELEEEQLPILPIDELDNLPKENDTWICNNLIRPKSANTIAGKRSTNKTWIGLSLGASISQGLPFLNHFITEKSNILFLDGESNKIAIKKRKNLVKEYLKIKNLDGFFVMSEYYLKIDNPQGIRQLEKAIKNLNIKLIIVDSYRRFISFDENDATQTSKFFIDYIKPLCNKMDVSFLFIHHQKKGESEGDDMDTIRGSSDFVNMMDSILQVKKKGKELTIKQTKNKFGKELPEFNIEIQTDETTFFGFKYIGLFEGYDVVCAKSIFEWAKGIKSFTYTEALEYAESKRFKVDTFKNARNILVERGMIQKKDETNAKSPYEVISDVWLEGGEL